MEMKNKKFITNNTHLSIQQLFNAKYLLVVVNRGMKSTEWFKECEQGEKAYKTVAVSIDQLNGDYDDLRVSRSEI